MWDDAGGAREDDVVDSDLSFLIGASSLSSAQPWSYLS